MTLAVEHGLTVERVARTFSIYPSPSGSITEAAACCAPRDLFASLGEA